MSSASAFALRLPLSVRLTALLALALLAAGCEGGSPPPGAYCDATPIFVLKCDGQFCHGSSTAYPPSGAVELVTPPPGMTLGQSLLNKTAMYPNIASSCPTGSPELIINGTTPAASLLLNKVTGTAPTNFACGERMPPLPISLDQNELNCLTEWVNGVAQTGGI